jgi:hypothetical protein
MNNVDLQQLIQALDVESRRDLENSADRVLDSMATGESLAHVHATLDADACVICEFV